MTGSFTKCNVIRTLILLQFSAKYLWLFPRCYETKNRPSAVCLLAARIGSTDQFHGSWWMPARATAGKKNTQKLFRIQRCRSQQQLFAASHKNAWLLLAIDWNIMNTFGDEMLCQCSEGTPTIFIYLADVFFFVYLQWQNGKLELQYKYKHIHCCCRCRCCKAPRLKWEKRAKSSCFSMLLRHWNR